MPRKIPATAITGFLGAGRTTLVRPPAVIGRTGLDRAAIEALVRG